MALPFIGGQLWNTELGQERLNDQARQYQEGQIASATGNLAKGLDNAMDQWRNDQIANNVMGGNYGGVQGMNDMLRLGMIGPQAQSNNIRAALPGQQAQNAANQNAAPPNPAINTASHYSDARAAIDSGADPQAVQARLQQMGLDPNQL